MPLITFFPSGKVIEVVEKTTLFAAALQAGLPVASSCSGEAVCGKCDMQILKGSENLSPRNDAERNLLEKEGCEPDNRMSCCTHVLGDCHVTAHYW